jgi:Tol biopolymer transport system component
MSTDGTRQRRFSFLSTPADRVEYPAWSPDGKLIAFSYLTGIAANELPKTSIWTINADGTNVRSLVEHGPNETLYYPQWSADGNYLYFTVENVSAEINTAQQPKRIDRVEIATGIRSQWIPSASQPAPTGAGEELVFVEELTDPDNPYSRLNISKATSDEAPHTAVVPNSAFYDLYAPKVSPDGKWVVFAAAQTTSGKADNPSADFDFFSWLTFQPRTASAHNFPWDLYLVPASGGKIQRLTNLNDDQPYSAWIDNQTIAFIGIKGLFKLTVDETGKAEGDPVRLTDGVQHSALTWHAP